MSTTQQVLAYAEAQPQGTTFSAKEVLHLGERAAIDQALTRLTRRGELLRVSRGLYTCPVETRFGKGVPEPEKVAYSVAARTGETITSTGAVASNQLGLTTQNPMGMMYLTSGQTRDLTLGQLRITLKHAPAWQLCAPTSIAGHALRALVWMGEAHAKQTIEHLSHRLNPTEMNQLVGLRAGAPTWVARSLGRLLQDAG